MRQLSENEKVSYQIVGQALTAFGEIERSICEIYCTLLSAQLGVGQHAFWGVQSFEARLKMTRNLAVKRLPRSGATAPFRREWEAICETVSKLNGKRNELAHGSYVSFGWEAKNGWETDEFFAPYHNSSFLKPKPLKAHKNDPRPNSRLRIADLEKCLSTFEQTTLRIYHFNISLHQNAAKIDLPLPY